MKNILAVFVTILLAAHSTCVLAQTTPHSPKSQAESNVSEQRTKLWQALLKSWSSKEKKIEVYAENPTCTEVCFRSDGQTYLFTTRTGKVHHVEHAKVIAPEINCITYEPGKGGLGAFILWHSGDRQLAVGADE